MKSKYSNEKHKFTVFSGHRIIASAWRAPQGAIPAKSLWKAEGVTSSGGLFSPSPNPPHTLHSFPLLPGKACKGREGGQAQHVNLVNY